MGELTYSELVNHFPVLGIDVYFDESQKSRSCHRRLISSLAKLLKKSDHRDFLVEFIQLLNSTLVQNEKSPHAIKVIEFAAKFCCHIDDPIIMSSVVSWVSKASAKKITILRERSCEFFSLLLQNMGAAASIDSDVFELITEVMLDRLQDKLTSIRASAVVALQRLQEPHEPDCPVMKAYIYHLENDPSPDVRKKILQNIAISQKSLPIIIGRSRDISEAVRVEVYHKLSLLKINRFKINMRQTLLYDGLNDRSGVVRDYVMNNLITTWMEHCDHDYLKLLEQLDVESLVINIAKTLLFSLFKRRPSANLIDLIKELQNPDKVVPPEKMTPEIALLWLYVVKYFKSPPEGVLVDQDLLSEILPKLTFFSQYLKGISADLVRGDVSREYIVARLLELALEFDLDDEKGRQEMAILCRTLLVNWEVESDNLISILAKSMAKLIPDVPERLTQIAEITSDIKHPLVADVILKSDRDSNGPLVNELNSLSLDQTTQNEEETATPEALTKCLMLITESLKAPDITSMNSMLWSLEQHVISPCLTGCSQFVTSLAITPLSLLCLLDLELAQKNFLKFCVLMEDEGCRLSAVEAVFDQILVHGFESLLRRDSQTGPTENGLAEPKHAPLDLKYDRTFSSVEMKSLMSRIAVFLESPVAQIRAITSQGFSKLLLSGQIESPLVLAHLVALWFSPDHGRDPYVSQPLGMFFNIYPRSVKGAGEVILKSLIPLLEELSIADSDTQMFLVAPVPVAKLLISLIRHDIVPPLEKEGSYHLKLAIALSDEVINRPMKQSKLFPTFVKCFSFLEMPKSDKEHAAELMEKLPSVISKVSKLSEKIVKNTAVNFYTKLSNLWGLGDKQFLMSVQKKKVSKSYDMSLNEDSANITIRRSRVINSTFRDAIAEDPEPPLREMEGIEDVPSSPETDRNNMSPSAEKQFVPGTPEMSEDEFGSDEDFFQTPPVKIQRR